MSARIITVGPSPLRSRPTTPVLPTPEVTSKPAVPSRSVTMDAVRSSCIDSSGCRCTSLYSASSSPSICPTPSKTDAASPSLMAPPSGTLLRLQAGTLARAQHEHHLVDVAPTPILARLDRANDRMPGIVGVLAGVFVR